MAINYPANPTHGQVYLQYIYDSTIPGWRNQNSSEGIGLQFKSGLIPVTPSSVAVSSGSATVDADGLITFTGTGGVYVNSAFTSAYKNYRVLIYRLQASVGTLVYARMRASGGDKSGAVYFTPATWVNSASGASGVYTGFNGITFTELCPVTVEAGWTSATMDFFQPALSDSHTIATFTGTGYSSGVQTRTGHVMYNVAEAIDGFSLWPSTGGATLSGKIRIYGYN